jgi:hypothetical protein
LIQGTFGLSFSTKGDLVDDVAIGIREGSLSAIRKAPGEVGELQMIPTTLDLGLGHPYQPNTSIRFFEE